MGRLGRFWRDMHSLLARKKARTCPAFSGWQRVEAVISRPSPIQTQPGQAYRREINSRRVRRYATESGPIGPIEAEPFHDRDIAGRSGRETRHAPNRIQFLRAAHSIKSMIDLYDFGPYK